MNFDYAARQLSGVLRMVWGAPDWEEGIGRSIDDVFRSFQAIAIALPIAVVGYFSLRRAADRIPELQAETLLQAPYPLFVGVQSASFLADWALSIVLLLGAARALGAARRAGDLIITYNWAQVPAVAVSTTTPVVLSLTGDRNIAAFISLPATALLIAIIWGVLRRAMGIGVGPAVGLIVLLTLLGIFVGALFGWLAVALSQPG